MDKVEIRSNGHAKRTHVIVNGEELKMVKKVEFKVGVGEFNELTITFMADVDLEADVVPDSVYFEVEDR